jgi:hypothetical protein
MRDSWMTKSFAWAGAGLGLVAAAVFASATTGPMLVRLILFFITPLPIALAGLGWGWRSGLVAGGVGTGLVLVFAGPLVALAFAATQAVPMAALTYLALLSRVRAGDEASQPSTAPEIEWYPVGRIVLWAAVMAGFLAVGSLLLLADDLDGLRRSLGAFIKASLEGGIPQGGNPVKLGEEDLASLAEMALYALPAASAISWMASLLFNLWLAGRVTLASEQLHRPWPDLASIVYPPPTPLVFGAVLLATLAGGYASLAAWGFAGALFFAYLLMGLAIVHFTTRGKPWRPFALWGVYGSLLIFELNFLVAVAIAMLGLGETVLHLRARFARPPPSAPPPSLT